HGYSAPPTLPPPTAPIMLHPLILCAILFSTILLCTSYSAPSYERQAQSFTTITISIMGLKDPNSRVQRTQLSKSYPILLSRKQ
ncbi:Hypothetical protein FKW44_006226, partial [Caligus rogercresseyi]